MPMSRRKKSQKPMAATANALLETLAQSTGAGWFSEGQQKRLRSMIRNEFTELVDAGLIYDDVHLDMLEHQAELQYHPDGNKPTHEEPAEGAEAINVEIVGPEDEEPDCECSSEVLADAGMVIACEIPD